MYISYLEHEISVSRETNKQANFGRVVRGCARNLNDHIQILHTCSRPLTTISCKCGEESNTIEGFEGQLMHPNVCIHYFSLINNN